MKKQKYLLITIVILACLCMGIVDAIIQPGYAVKSEIKIVLFLMLPALYSLFDKECDLKKLFVFEKKGLCAAFLLALAVYASSITKSL